MGSRDAPELYRTIVIGVGLLAALGGCQKPASDSARAADSTTGAASTQVVTGTVRYLDVEGGFYGIVTDDGKKLGAVNLPAEFQTDGLRIRARVEPVRDQVSIRMWGTPVRIIEIQRL